MSDKFLTVEDLFGSEDDFIDQQIEDAEEEWFYLEEMEPLIEDYYEFDGDYESYYG